MKKLILNFLFSTCFVLFAFAQDTTKVKKDDIQKENQIEEVKIIKQKKAIEQKPDRTIFNISDQPNLNAGTLMETMWQE